MQRCTAAMGSAVCGMEAEGSRGGGGSSNSEHLTEVMRKLTAYPRFQLNSPEAGNFQNSIPTVTVAAAELKAIVIPLTPCHAPD